ncbi:MAG: hypothetical protein R3E63_02225 [Pseudomonadales bacterium]
MDTSNKYFDGADLALAAYANLTVGVTEATDNISALQDGDKGMSKKQAAYFAERWPSVVGQYTDDDTGLSVTVFRNGSDVCVAIRGTTPTDLKDLLADLQLGTGKIVDQYELLRTYFDSLKTSGVLTDTDNLVVAGHSLGGFLAQVLTIDRAGDIDSTYTYNAPGIGGVSLDVFGSVESVPVSNITNIQGDGLSTIASVGISAGLDKVVEIENASIFAAYEDHTVKKLTDSLAVYDTLWQLDNSLEISSFNDIFKQSSSSEDASLEGIVDALHKIFGISNSPLEIDNRDALYEAIHTLKESDSYAVLTNNASVQPSTNITATQAAIDFGAFLSLYQLSPVFISGAALQEPNQNLYGRWSAGEFSSQYLEDRIALLGTKLSANRADLDYLAVGGNSYYKDEASGTVISTPYGVPFEGIERNRILFGDDGANTLTGGNKNDHLYGGTGADTLKSGAGNDYLEGGDDVDILNAGTGFDRINAGAGADLYQIESNQFGDVVIASDTDGGAISLLSDISFRRVGEGRRKHR